MVIKKHLLIKRCLNINGAGNENRTRIFAMARRHNSRYTIPAQVCLLYQIILKKAILFLKKIKFFIYL